jgi:hypothetical protein
MIGFWEFVFNPIGLVIIFTTISLYLLYMKFNDSFRLILHIAINTFKILFRKKKKIKKIELHYACKSIFNKSYLTVKFHFDNAIWFQFKGIAIKASNGEIVFDIKNLKQKEIVFVVQGFFRKKVYEIEVVPDLALNAYSFKLQLHNLTNFSKKENLFPALLIKRVVNLKSRILAIKMNTPTVKKENINIKLSPYNQNNFI